MKGIDFVNNTITIGLSDYISMTILVIGFVLFSLAMVFVEIRFSRLLDRYRMKYGFDKDIELKEMDNPKNLEKRENSFKRRVFKD